MAVVLDASAAMSWLAASQATTASQTFFSNYPEMVAPFVFPIELRHVINRFERRGLVPVGGLDANLARLEREVSFAAAPELAQVVDLARRLGLGVYDACHLHLAIEAQAALASRDATLLAAAAHASVAVVDLR